MPGFSFYRGKTIPQKPFPKKTIPNRRPATFYLFSFYINLTWMAKYKIFKFVVSLGICLLAGYLNSLYALALIPSWFASLKKPGLLVPDSFFMPVGLVVYLLLGLTMYLIWKSETREYREKQACMILFIVSLVLNVGWVYIFFGLRSPYLGLLTIVLLFAILMATMYQSVRVSAGATILLIPYLLVTFAVAFTNYNIVMMNTGIPMFPI
jgi:benzodiazapine receptor